MAVPASRLPKPCHFNLCCVTRPSHLGSPIQTCLCPVPVVLLYLALFFFFPLLPSDIVGTLSVSYITKQDPWGQLLCHSVSLLNPRACDGAWQFQCTFVESTNQSINQPTDWLILQAVCAVVGLQGLETDCWNARWTSYYLCGCGHAFMPQDSSVSGESNRPGPVSWQSDEH